jgi:hypothetical protein
MAITNCVKIWLVILLLVPALAWAQDEEREELPVELPADGSTSAGEEELPPNWIDVSHTVASDSAQALVEWTDNFFGDPSYDLEKAESFLRLEFEHEWDEDNGNDFGVRLRGKVQLPKINKRVALVFADDDTAAADRAERSDEDQVSLQVNVRESSRSRFDGTLGWSSGAPKPGVRFRNEGNLGDTSRSYRYVQRLQWANNDGFFTIAQLDLFQALDRDDMIRWSNRIKWGEDTDGVEWRTRLSLFQRWYEETKRPLAVNHFLSIRGETRPDPYVGTYSLGTVVRRKIYRDFLFFEVEPSANFRQRGYDEDRDLAWQIVFRLEIHLARDLVKRRKKVQERRETRRAERRVEQTEQPE